MSKKHSLNISVSDIKGRAYVKKNEVKKHDLYRVDTEYDLEVPTNLLNIQCLNEKSKDLDDAQPRNVRIALYSPDTMGLGHMRRCRKIAKALVTSPLQPVVLMINGARESRFFSLPPGVDSISLPAIHKGLDGEYSSRSLGFSLEELISLRAKTIHAILEAFEPDVLIVDKTPRGAVMELDSILQYLHDYGSTLCILGLRDILDDPEVVRREWHRAMTEDVINKYYDAVWVYGDPSVYDLAREYRFSSNLLDKISYTGYLGQSKLLRSTNDNGDDVLGYLSLPPGRLVCCLVGGGQDGADLAEAFAQADLSEDMNGVILMGPFMPVDVQLRLRKYAEINKRLWVVGFISEPTELLNRADAVICMGGYNTICEVLSYGKRALVIPRVKPRIEQLIRAERLQNLGLIDMIHPNQLRPELVTQWLACKSASHSRGQDQIDLNGLARLPKLLENLLIAQPHPSSGEIRKGET
jgi:predicted glycosyltransferase